MDKDGNEVGILTGKAPRQAALKAANRCCAEITLRRAKQKNAYIHRREEAGKETQGRTCMDANQDLETQFQEGWRSEAGRSLKPLAVHTLIGWRENNNGSFLLLLLLSHKY
jgi:hypothetical protein